MPKDMGYGGFNDYADNPIKGDPTMTNRGNLRVGPEFQGASDTNAVCGDGMSVPPVPPSASSFEPDISGTRQTEA